ncbi:LuxR C-terminal-related transcriptional regulator [Chitinophagaceae bacterium MMS25-I14]
MNIHVVVAYDHPIFITGLHAVLAHTEHIRITGTYPDIALFEQRAGEQPADVLLADVPAGRWQTLHSLSRLSAAVPGLHVLVTGNAGSMLSVHAALQNGAHGYLAHNADGCTIIQAIETVYKGRIFLTEEHRSRLEQYRYQLDTRRISQSVLTAREADVLRLVIAGYSSSEIAARLFLGVRTVENYRLNLCVKLEAKNTAVLVRKAIESELLEE